MLEALVKQVRFNLISFFLMQNYFFTLSILGLKSVQEQKDGERQQKQETQAKARKPGGDLMSDLVIFCIFKHLFGG